MATEPEWRTATWYAKPNDLIGGWCIGVDERPPSKEGVWLLGDFMNEDVARHIVALHNEALGAAADVTAALLVEVRPAGIPGKVLLSARNAGPQPLTQQEAASVLRDIGVVLAGQLYGSWLG